MNKVFINKKPKEITIKSFMGIFLVGLTIYCMNYSALDMIVGFFSGYHHYVLSTMLLTLGIIIVTLTFKNYRIKIRIEQILLLTWFFWCLFTINFFHDHIYQYETFPLLLKLVLMCVVLFLTYNCVILKNPLKVLFVGFFLGGVLISILSVISGQVVSVIIKPDHLNRLGSEIVGNSNDYAYLLMFAIFACVYFLYLTPKKYKKIFLLAFIALLFFFIVLSASRKALLCTLSFFLLAFYNYYQPSKKKKILISIPFILFMGCLIITIGTQTFMGERLQKGLEIEVQADSLTQRAHGRGRLYVQATELLPKHFIVGVGLGNFHLVDEFSEASHSEYISLLIGTGIPGFILYFLVYLLIFLRLNKIKKFSRDKNTIFNCKLLQSIIITILLIDFGRWNYSHYITYIFMAVACAYSYKYHHRIPKLS